MPISPLPTPDAAACTGPDARSPWQRYWYLPVLAAYAAVVAVTAARHEPWFDEGQAWLIARDLSPWGIFAHILRYEGSPGLWHLLLLLPAKMHLPYPWIGVIAALLACAGCGVFLACSPLPRVLTALLPFTFYLCYQYAVIARSYVLLPLLLFALAALGRTVRRHPVLRLLLLCALAGVSIHGTLLALALLAIDVHGLWRVRRALPLHERRLYLSLLAIFVGVLLVIAWQLWLPADLLSVTGHRDPLSQRLLLGLEAVSHAMTEQGWLAALVVLLSLWWFRETRTLAAYLLPTGALLAFFVLKYVNSWHEGILFLAWLYALWVSFDAYRAMDDVQRRRPSLRAARIGILAAAGLVVAIQLAWAYRTVDYDLRHRYSGSRAVADYLVAHRLTGASICAYSFHANGILPYFDRNLFRNFDDLHGASFWFWSRRQQSDRTVGEALASRPDVFILGIKFVSLTKLPWGDPRFVYNVSPDYRFVAFIDGRMFWKTKEKEYDAFAIYLRKDFRPPTPGR